MNTESKKPRYLFLDNIKVLFTILVIFQHVRVTYGGSGGWYYVEAPPNDLSSIIFFILLTSIGGLFQASLMGLFFLMGGILLLKVMIEKVFVPSGKNDFFVSAFLSYCIFF